MHYKIPLQFKVILKIFRALSDLKKGQPIFLDVKMEVLDFIKVFWFYMFLQKLFKRYILNKNHEKTRRFINPTFRARVRSCVFWSQDSINTTCQIYNLSSSFPEILNIIP